MTFEPESHALSTLVKTSLLSLAEPTRQGYLTLPYRLQRKSAPYSSFRQRTAATHALSAPR